MKKLFNIAAIATIALSLCLSLVACESKPNLNSDVNEVIGATTDTSLKVKVTTFEGATGYNYAISTTNSTDAFNDGSLEGEKGEKTAAVKELTFENLTPNTTYFIYVQAFAGKSKGPVSKERIETATPPKTEWDLDVKMEMTGNTENSILVKFKSIGADAEALKYAVGKSTDLDKFKAGTLVGIKTTSDMTIRQANFVKLNRGENYTIFVQASGDGQQGDVITLDTRTLKLEFKAEVVPGSITSTTAQIIVTPGGDVANYKYYLGGVEELELFNSGSLPGIMMELDATKPRTFNIAGLNPNTRNALLLRPFAENGTRLETFVVEFRTLPKQ